jgi:hypothetical protein
MESACFSSTFQTGHRFTGIVFIRQILILKQKEINAIWGHQKAMLSIR